MENRQTQLIVGPSWPIPFYCVIQTANGLWRKSKNRFFFDNSIKKEDEDVMTFVILAPQFSSDAIMYPPISELFAT